VRSIVRHAYSTVPYYRETMSRLGLTPMDLRTAADIAKLPILEPWQLTRDPEYFVSRAAPVSEYTDLHTSGTSGHPRCIYYDRKAMFQNAAFGQRERAVLKDRIGSWSGYREVVVAPASFSSLRTLQGLLRETALLPSWASRQRLYLTTGDEPLANIRRIAEFRPDVIYGFGSYLALLFASAEESGIELPGLRAVVFSSDAMPVPARRRITERYGVPVLAHYGSIEVLKIAFDCGTGAGLHLNEDICPMRIVDANGRTLPPGETGEVIVSNLVNRATVLLNYRIGDTGRFTGEPCTCGRNLALIDEPHGRCNENVILSDGRVVHASVFPDILDRAAASAWQFQVIQEAPDRIRVLIVCGSETERKRIAPAVQAGMARALGPEVSVCVEFVDAVFQRASGKTPVVVTLAESR